MPLHQHAHGISECPRLSALKSRFSLEICMQVVYWGSSQEHLETSEQSTTGQGEKSDYNLVPYEAELNSILCKWS